MHIMKATLAQLYCGNMDGSEILSVLYMKRVLHLVSVKNISFKSSYNWFKYWHSSAAQAADSQL